MRAIYIVDDDPSILSIFDFILSQQGHTISSFSSFQDSLSLVQKAPPDIILLDLTLTQDSSISHIKRYLKINPNILVIGMLDFRDAGLYSSAFEQGAYALIFKPFDAEEVMSIVTHADKYTLAS